MAELLRGGADTGARVSFRTPLYAACYQGHCDVADALIRARKDRRARPLDSVTDMRGDDRSLTSRDAARGALQQGKEIPETPSDISLGAAAWVALERARPQILRLLLRSGARVVWCCPPPARPFAHGVDSRCRHACELCT